MKILIATGIFPPEIGGPATYAGLLAEQLKKRGDEVTVLPFRDVRQYPKIIRHFIYFCKVVKMSVGMDIIFTQDPVSTGIPVVCAAFFNNKKVVMRVAGDYAWEQSVQKYGVKDSIYEFQKKKYSILVEILRTLQKFSVNCADMVVTPSKYFSALVGGWVHNTREIKTIYNGIDLDTSASWRIKKEAKFSDMTMISAGRLVSWKGFDTLIKVLKDMPGWKLLIAGDGPDKGRLEALALELGVNDRVQFLGQLPRAELFEQIYKSHVFALLSTFESFSFQIVEAMNVGTPVIASNIGNLSEIIENEKNGILINPTDTDLFKEKVGKIVLDPVYSSKLSENGISRSKDFSIEKTFDQLRTVFEEVISKK